MNGHSYEEQLQGQLNQALSDLKDVETRMQTLQSRLDSLKEEVRSCETVLLAYRKRTGRDVISQNDGWLSQLEGQTHKDKVLAILRRQGGQVKTADVTNMLFGKRLIKSKSRTNAYMIVQRALRDAEEDGLVTKVRPGEYRLIDAQALLPVKTSEMEPRKELVESAIQLPKSGA